MRALGAVLGIAAALSLSSGAFAQDSASNARPASVRGFAVDSVRGGYLRDALVTIIELKRTTTTDSLGQFHFDSIPPGQYSFRLSHAILDTLGMSVSTRQTQIAGGTQLRVALGVPSPATVVDRKCSDSLRAAGNAALTGVVLDADTDLPSIGAEVVVQWTDIAVSSKSIRKTQRERRAAIHDDGTYLVCGIPQDLVTGIFAARASDSTAVISVSFERRLVMQSFHLPSPGVGSSSTSGTLSGTNREPGKAELAGKITGPDGSPLQGVRVAVESDTVSSITDEKGNYHLGSLRAGTRSVSLRKIGYQATERVVDLTTATPATLNVKLSAVSQVLETVKVQAMRDIGLERVGFTERKKYTAGHFLDQRAIDGRNAPKLGVLLETDRSIFRHCIRYWVDGHPWSSMSDRDTEMGPDAFLSGAEIAAVETYTPLTAPGEFISVALNGEQCSAVVVWTKQKIYR